MWEVSRKEGRGREGKKELEKEGQVSCLKKGVRRRERGKKETRKHGERSCMRKIDKKKGGD